jgi:hypothetical protein
MPLSRLPLLLFAAALAPHTSHAPAHSQWVYPGHSGKLQYKALPTGDRILDFSYAGYMAGGIALPNAPVRKTLAPTGADDTAAIQSALDEVAALPPTKGIRGAVLLQPGHFHLAGTLRPTSGVVLRGSGSNDNGTLLEMTGDPHYGISITGADNITALAAPIAVTQAYVPSGSLSLTIADTTGLHPGDRVQITHPLTPEWVHLMGMDTLSRNGKKETWVSRDLTTERTLTAVHGHTLTFDVPLADNYDSKLLGPTGATVTKVEETGLLSQIGVEDLRITAPARKVTLNDKQFNTIEIAGAQDVWVRNLRIVDAVGAVNIRRTARRITVTQVDITHSIPIQGAAKPADFSTDGTQTLLDRCSGTGDNVFYLATGVGSQGPNVLLHGVFHGNGHIQPHQRWSTGLLIDGTQVPDGGIDLMNRGEMGSGHGWTMGWAVAWNNIAKSFVIQMPPGSANWSIGNTGEQQIQSMPIYDGGPKRPLLPQGITDSQDTPVTPASLYLQQLKDRLGPQALKNIGY